MGRNVASVAQSPNVNYSTGCGTQKTSSSESSSGTTKALHEVKYWAAGANGEENKQPSWAATGHNEHSFANLLPDSACAILTEH